MKVLYYLAITLILLIFSLMLFHFVYFDGEVPPAQQIESPPKSQTITTNRSTSNSSHSGSCDIVNTEIKCIQLDMKTEVGKLNDVLKQAKNQGVVNNWTLILSDSKFPENRIDPNWITLSNEHAAIKYLEIEGDYQHMSSKSFQNLPHVQDLTIIITQSMNYLEWTVFDSLPQLTTMAIRVTKGSLTHIQKGFLHNLNVTSFQISGVFLPKDGVFPPEEESIQFFTNLTKDGSDLIQIFDISHNYIPVIAAGMITGMPNVKSVYASNSGIKYFEKGSLINLNNLALLNLQFNNLTTLQIEDFRCVIPKVQLVYVGNNSFICDCKMKWIQVLLMLANYGDFPYVVCSEPLEIRNQPILTAHFCMEDIPNTTTPCVETTTETISDTTTTTTTSTETSITIINCREENQERKLIKRSAKLKSVAVHDHNYKINIDEKEIENGLKLMVSFDTNTTQNLLWFQEDEENNAVCKFSMDGPMNLEEAKYNTTYMFCGFNEGEEVSIFDCFPYKTMLKRSERTWITYGNIPDFAGIAIAVIVFSLSLGGGLLYFLVRRKPTLIRGSNRVLEVECRKEKHLMILPRDLKQTLKEFEANRKREGSDSCSLYSDSFSTVSYVSVLTPSSYETITYELERLKESKAPPPPEPRRRKMLPKIPSNVDPLIQYEWFTVARSPTTSGEILYSVINK